MNGFLQMCLQVPNLGTLIFFVIFVLAIPGLLMTTNNYDVLKYYFPFVVMLAAALTEAGAPRYFDTLYPYYENTLAAFLSKNFINLLALVAILISVISDSMENNNIITGLVAGVLAFMFTFPIAGTVIPFFIRKGDEELKKRVREGVRFPGNWHKYLIGFIFIIMAMILQLGLTRWITKDMLTTSLTTGALDLE